MKPETPLQGLTVLDLSRVLAGPYATQMLGDLGADVWKIEHPAGGDETRTWGPPFVGDQSAYFLSINRNKRSAALDLRDPASLAAVREAARRADVVVENFLPGRLAEFGLDAATLRASNPELIVCSITGYGQDGPYATLPGYDVVLQGFTGLMSVTGDADGPPRKVGVAAVDVLTGVHAAASILAALVGRLRGASGTHIDIALFEVGVASLVNMSQAALVTGVPWRRHGNAHPQIVPYQTFEASDGMLVVAVGNDGQWRRLCEALGAPEWAAHPGWATNSDRLLHRAEVVDALAARFATQPRARWIETLQASHVPCGAVRDLVEAVNDPALLLRDLVRRTPGAIPVLALPWLSGGVRPPLTRRPPRLGEHTAEFMASFGTRA